MAMPTLVALGRGWTPEEAARHEAALFRALSSDKKALRVYLQKVRVVEMVRRQQGCLSPCRNVTKDLGTGAATGADRRSSAAGQPIDAAAEPRARRRKSEAQRVKSVQKLRRKKLQARCEAAAAKAGGSPPKVLARVLACCGRFLELLHPEGAARMERLRQVEALSNTKVDAMVTDMGLDAMRAALAATEAGAAMDGQTDGGRQPYRAALQKSLAPVVAQGSKANKGTSMAISRRGLCPASAEQDPHWHGANACRWSKPGE